MIRYFLILEAAGTAEVVKGQIKGIVSFFVAVVIFGAVFANVHSLFGGADFRRGSVFVGSADIENLVAQHSIKPRIHVRRKQTAYHMSQMRHTVYVG